MEKTSVLENYGRLRNGDLPVSMVGNPIPADMSVRTIPGWTENARILGLSVDVIRVSRNSLHTSNLWGWTFVHELRDFCHAELGDCVGGSSGILFNANRGRDIDERSRLLFPKCRERSDVCVCHCVGPKEVGLL